MRLPANEKLWRAAAEYCASGRTVGELCKEAKFSRDALQNWVYRGMTPKPIYMDSLCRVLGKTAEELGFDLKEPEDTHCERI